MTCRVALRPSVLSTIGLLALLTACTHDATAPGETVAELTDALLVSAPDSAGLVYVSMTPNGDTRLVSGTVGTGLGTPTSVTMAGGGFDPVAIAARAGDVVRVAVHRSFGGDVAIRHTVPYNSLPRVVRTAPSDGATGVGVLDSIVVVFSEPMDVATLTAGVRLTNKVDRQYGLARPIPACESGLCARLDPSTPLLGNDQYTLSLADSIRGRSGQLLSAQRILTFGTAASKYAPANLTVDQFTVIEYQTEDGNWHYAPQLTVSDTSHGSGSAVYSFGFDIPGVSSPTYLACSTVLLAPTGTLHLFQSPADAFSVTASERATMRRSSAELWMIINGYPLSVTMDGPIVSGPPPVIDPGRTDNWLPYYC